MNKWRFLLLLSIGSSVYVLCSGSEPFRPPDGAMPFLVYYHSQYRGICVGILVSRMAVLTAAVCVTHPIRPILSQDRRPINVVTGVSYRHQLRGIRVQVTKVVIPKLPNVTSHRGYMLQKSPALLILKRKVPDALVEIPLRALDIDWKGEEELNLQEECLIAGWHFFYRGDLVYPVHKFLLQRNMRAQFVNIVKKHIWCEALLLKFQNTLDSFGFSGYIDRDATICTKDIDRTAQACHGMYGAPLICRGRAVGMMMAPDAQWGNCTGYTNIIHMFRASDFTKGFMKCISRLFNPEYRVDWERMKKNIFSDFKDDEYDYLPAMYDRLVRGSDSSSSEY